VLPGYEVEVSTEGVIPLHRKEWDLPKVPEKGMRDSAELTGVAGVTTEPYSVESAISADLYSYTRTTYRRNLYRIPLP